MENLRVCGVKDSQNGAFEEENMKRILSVILSLIIVLMAFSFVSCGNETTTDTPDEPEITYGKTLYVSPDGDDANDGSESAPLATFAGARDAVRKLKAEAGLPENGVCVLFSAGE